jgi:hypothetical protein
MLSPPAYHRYCPRLFGDILDHNGGFGVGEGELRKLAQVLEETAKLWQQEFGVPFTDTNNPWHRFVGCEPW